MARSDRLATLSSARAPLWRGLDYGPAVVVLSPSATRPRELPDAWRPLEQLYQVAWCAVPPQAGGAGSLDRLEDVLETLADRATRTQVVAHTALTEVACQVVAEFPEIVRGLVLVGQGRVRELTGVPTTVVPVLGDPVGPGVLARLDVVADVAEALAVGERRIRTRPRLAGVLGLTGTLGLVASDTPGGVAVNG
ncbi:hypothetical protein [Actinokineospora globicatena]|uniref:hypothetical protein n=1 Tax=Actinokineospora globicatena TaxID=103729 RepID=UPI0020A39AE9|nr:hypothetical protein [Actinokineospora globicatena]MCP2304467.1 hypothetical protein [Actinokineospora globicatena]GLW78167.1 hypothetical protein Aglo01_26490 [Actinokineospora globicatena]GLW85167.1 hypothetical protein Aglo02_28070 [Actinokineospora globicatena]